MTTPSEPPSEAPLDEYPIDAAGVPGPAARSRRGVALAVAATLVCLIGVIGLVSRAGGRTGGNPTPTTIAPPEPIGLGSPIDGRSSLRLPVRVTPDHDLVDGQTVLVTVSGFRPRVTVGAVICTNDAQTKGAAACDIGNVVATAMTSADGRATIPYTIRRYPTINGGPYDCMQGNVFPPDYEQRLRQGLIPATQQPGWFTCIVAVGQIDDYDQSGGWPFALRGQTFRVMEDTGTSVPATTTTTAPTTTVASPTTGSWVTTTTTPTATTEPATTAPTVTTSTPPGTGRPISRE